MLNNGLTRSPVSDYTFPPAGPFGSDRLETHLDVHQPVADQPALAELFVPHYRQLAIAKVGVGQAGANAAPAASVHVDDTRVQRA